MGRNLTSQMVYYPIVKMTNKIIQQFASQNDYPNHIGQVQINLSKLTGWSFWHFYKWGPSWLDFLIKIIYFYNSVGDVITGSTCFMVCGMWPSLGIIQHTYTSFTTTAYHGARVSWNFNFVNPLSFIIWHN
jgi:hypothetical protein